MYYDYIKTSVMISVYIKYVDLFILYILGTYISILTVVQYRVWGRRHIQDTQIIGGL